MEQFSPHPQPSTRKKNSSTASVERKQFRNKADYFFTRCFGLHQRRFFVRWWWGGRNTSTESEYNPGFIMLEFIQVIKLRYWKAYRVHLQGAIWVRQEKQYQQAKINLLFTLTWRGNEFRKQYRWRNSYWPGYFCTTICRIPTNHCLQIFWHLWTISNCRNRDSRSDENCC